MPSVCFAHAPSEINLEYDLEEQKLNIEIIHVTKDIKEHFIRKITVRKNNEEPFDHFLHWQKENKKVLEEISVSAEEGDIFTVKATCKKGGSTTASMLVELPKEDEAEKALLELK